MSLEIEKSMRIVSDLVSFCHRMGGKEFTMKLKHHADDSTEMWVQCPIEGLPGEKVENIRCTLNLPRRHEIEQHYWELSGEAEFGDELSLVSAMCDAARVEYANNILDITILRKD